jgi:nucleotide-binding universal stress UspA family protein
MFKNVLVGIDGRQSGRDALLLASRLVDADGKLTLVHVRSGVFHDLKRDPGEIHAAEKERSDELLRRERSDICSDAEIASIFAPNAARGLHEYADEHGADLIVVGSCSRGLLGRAMLGDDSRGALNGTPCAVAVAARGYASNPVPIEKIGVGYDASPEASAALSVAKELARERGGEVAVLQVVTVPPVMYTGMIPPVVGESADVLVEEASGRLRQIPDVKGRAVYGVPGEELAAFGDELDLLVVGSRNFGPVRRRIVGSTCDYLERHARCSLLTLPRVGDAQARTESSSEFAATAV